MDYFYYYFMVIQSFWQCLVTVHFHCMNTISESLGSCWLMVKLTQQTTRTKACIAEMNWQTAEPTAMVTFFCYWTVVRVTGAKHRCGSTGRWSQRSKGHLELKSCCYASEFNYDPYGVMNTHTHTHTHTQSKSLWWRVKCVITTISFNYVNFPDNNNLGIFSRDLHILL